jgi:hypothetical protein
MQQQQEHILLLNFCLHADLVALGTYNFIGGHSQVPRCVATYDALKPEGQIESPGGTMGSCHQG